MFTLLLARLPCPLLTKSPGAFVFPLPELRHAFLTGLTKSLNSMSQKDSSLPDPTAMRKVAKTLGMIIQN